MVPVSWRRTWCASPPCFISNSHSVVNILDVTFKNRVRLRWKLKVQCRMHCKFRVEFMFNIRCRFTFRFVFTFGLWPRLRFRSGSESLSTVYSILRFEITGYIPKSINDNCQLWLQQSRRICHPKLSCIGNLGKTALLLLIQIPFSSFSLESPLIQWLCLHY